MAVIPTGRPAVERAADIESYGGNVNKRNYLSVGSIDPETDVSSEEISRVFEHLAAAARTVPFCVLYCQCNDSSPAAPTVLKVLQMTGVDIVGYEGDAAPATMPALARVSDGKFTVTWPTTFADPYSVVGTLTIKMASGTNASASGGSAPTQVTSATAIDVSAFDAAGAAYQDARVTIEVW